STNFPPADVYQSAISCVGHASRRYCSHLSRRYPGDLIMRILHTSDWHLGLRLSGCDRTDDLFSQVGRICQLAEENKCDVLLVAGDVFVNRSPENTKRLADLLSPYVRRGLHIVLVRGNHDKPDHFQMMRALLAIEGESERVHVAQT